jgi:uncharacterized repeat protein (TIGR03803 family)
LSPAAGGGWTEKIIHSFNGNDGCNPMSSLIWDSAGNLYGTASNQGSSISPSCTNYGTVFKLTPPTTTVGWPESTVHVFLAKDGNYPNGIVFDSAGNIYGTTYLGGQFGFGGIFKLTPTGIGTWTETAVHMFTGHNDGGWPLAGVILGPDGNLYGTTSAEGAHISGVVFQSHP